MKRIIIPGLMLAAAFAFTNCTEQLVSPVQKEDVVVDETLVMTYEAGTPFEVEVEDLETKTATTPDGRTYWLDGDLISLYSSDHSQKADAKTYSHHNKFAYKKEKRNFYGVLSTELARYNDWYAIYPYNSGSAGTLTAEKVTIGGAVGDDYKQYQQGNEDMSHIYGDNYPLYGIKNNVYKSSTPKFKMSPLFSLIALEIANEGDGISNNGNASITVNNVQFTAAEEIVGQFSVNILETEPVFSEISNASSKTAKLECTNVTVESGNTATIYLAVKPHDASGDKITVSINGSSKSLTLPNNFKFEAGKITTLRVPLKLSYPKASDAIALTSKGTKSDDKAEKILTLPDPRDMNINGEIVPVYVLGENGNKGTITVRGYAKDMFAALPVGFYASRWNDLPTAMTLHSINAWLPEYKNNGSWYSPKYDYTDINKRTEIRSYGSLAAFNLILNILGIKLFDNTYGILRTTIESFVDNIAKMTFKGMVTNGDFDNNNVIILDENPVYKEVSPAKVDEFLSSFSADVNGKKCVATCAGLMSILIDATANSDGSFTFPDDESRILAEDTANAIFYKLENTIAKVNESLKGLIGIFFSNPTDLMRKLRDTKFQIVIETRPYEDTEGAPLNPIVFWGFDAYGPDDSVPEN